MTAQLLATTSIINEKFKGFTNSETFTPLPDPFFRQLLKEIDEVEELKVTAYVLWRFGNMEGPFQALAEGDFDPAALGLEAGQVRAGLEKAVQRGSLLRGCAAAAESRSITS